MSSFLTHMPHSLSLSHLLSDSCTRTMELTLNLHFFTLLPPPPYPPNHLFALINAVLPRSCVRCRYCGTACRHIRSWTGMRRTRAFLRYLLDVLTKRIRPSCARCFSAKPPGSFCHGPCRSRRCRRCHPLRCLWCDIHGMLAQYGRHGALKRSRTHKHGGYGCCYRRPTFVFQVPTWQWCRYRSQQGRNLSRS